CLFCFVALHPLRATLFPYTTLFRSLYRFGQFHVNRVVWRGFWLIRERHGSFRGKSQQRYRSEAKNDPGNHADVPPFHRFLRLLRSEEHTSELQSHLNLVCRLLLEK